MEERESQPGKDEESSTDFFKRDETIKNLQDIMTSSWAPYESPKSQFHKIVTILCVAHRSKLADTQHEKGGKSCPILNLYRELLDDTQMTSRLRCFMKKALENLKDEKESDLGYSKRQTSISDFFTKKSNETLPKSSLLDQARATPFLPRGTDESGKHKAASNTNNQETSNFQKLFDVLNVSGADKVEKALKINSVESETLLKSAVIIEKLLRLKRSLDHKAHWIQGNSKFAQERIHVLSRIEEMKRQLTKLVELCDREQDAHKATTLPMEDFTAYLQNKVQEANKLSKDLFLQLNDINFRNKISNLIRKIQKRLSRLDNTKSSTSSDLEVICGKSGSSWNECLQTLSDWRPTEYNGNITLDHFERCKSFFISLQINQDDFADANKLLDFLKIAEKRKKVLNTLVENLPLMLLQKNEEILVIDTVQFLQSKRMLVEFTQLFTDESNPDPDKLEDNDNTIETGPHIEDGRKGKKRKVDGDPRILEVARDYAESAGVASHSRRRETVGRFGFTMTDLHKVITSKLFSQDPSKAPSVATLRRFFEPPSKARKTRDLYKSDIQARPGIKMNEDSSYGGPHAHRHQCFSSVKAVREYWSLYPHETVVIAGDNKV